MSAAPRARAPSGAAWNSINWSVIQRHVRGLQARIVKATQGGRQQQGESPAMAADPLVQRQSISRQAGDRK